MWTAGSLRIETFEGSRPRLRRMRQGYGRWMGTQAGDVVRYVRGNDMGESMRQRVRKREEGWGLLKVAFRIAFGLC
jgi:hypothetical protein